MNNMKKSIQRLAVLSVLLIGITLSGSAQIIVKVRPRATVVVRTAPPSPRHVWIDAGWAVRGGRYVQMPGYWVVPRRGFYYVPGYWKHTRRGYIWVDGYWTKKRGRRF